MEVEGHLMREQNIKASDEKLGVHNLFAAHMPSSFSVNQPGWCNGNAVDEFREFRHEKVLIADISPAFFSLPILLCDSTTNRPPAPSLALYILLL